VKCYDDDTFTNDDFLTSGKTDSNGCVALDYTTKSWNFFWWSRPVIPDIFCEVSGKCLKPTVTHTKENHDQETIANFGDVNVDTDNAFCNDETWNGCGPEFLPGFINDMLDSITGFQDQCNRHDVCYSTCSRTREECDNEFKSLLEEMCGIDPFCALAADMAYNAVWTAGEDACKSSRTSCTMVEQEMCEIK